MKKVIRKFRLPIIVVISFLLGGLTMFLMVYMQLQQSHSRDLLFGYTLKSLYLDEGAISEDTKVIKSLGTCLGDYKSCDLQKMTTLGAEYEQQRATLTTQQNQIHMTVQSMNK